MVRTLVLTAFAALLAMVVAARPAAAHTGAQSQQAQPAAQPAGALINLNSATQAELEKLPGVGPAMAKQIIEYRQKNGGFKKIEELMNVKGIGEKSFLKLKALVTVAPAKTER
jgi:competence protein ComEA